MDSAAGLLYEAIEGRLRRRGWHFRVEGDVVTGRVQDWPRQLYLHLDPGARDRTPSLGLAVKFQAMPLGGERFRDILNADREEMLLAFGSFRVRQLLDDGTWAAELNHRTFMHGYGSGSGVTRRTVLAVFDRCPGERGVDLADRLVADLPRLAETGAGFSSTLQRVYQRTVLGGPATPGPLPDVVGRVPAVQEIFTGTPLEAEATYPWRR